MMFRFVAGNKLLDAIKLGKQMTDKKITPIINYINENKNNSQNTFNEYMNLLDKVNFKYMVAIKLSSLDFNIRLINKIANKCANNNIKLIVDAEDSENIDKYRDIVNGMNEYYNYDKINIIKTYQMYRKDSLYELDTDIKNSFIKSYYLAPKLVRGAYWNQEKNNGQLFTDKKDTDNNYRDGIITCQKHNLQYGILATHNHESINFAKTLYTIKNRYLFANLKGMNEEFMNSIDVENRAVYLPYGPYIKMIPYLSRRLYENLDSIKYITK